VFDQVTGSFRFVPGPVFANVVLVDEINRSTPRTQSALLEPMEERQVTVEGVTHALPEPYLVIATQNPVEQHGTYPLPEGQLDRFALAVGVGYPDEGGATELVRRQLERHPLNDLEQVLTPQEVRTAQDVVRTVHVDEAVLRYAVELVTATRAAPELALGASPRASVWLVRTAQARAVAMARDYVLPDDVKALAIPALAHRVLAKDARASGPTCRGVIARLLEEVPIPLHATRGA
jgi:MoxR-like ATPase